TGGTGTGGTGSGGAGIPFHILEGSAEVQGADGTWQPAAGDARLPVGRRIKTSAIGQVLLTFPDGATLRGLPRTILRINDQGAIVLEEGATDDVQGPTASKHPVIVSPVAVAEPTGTLFSVEHDQATNITTVTVREGEVRVTPTNPALRAVILHA